MELSPDLLDSICSELATGGSVKGICTLLGLDRRELMKKIAKSEPAMRALHAARVTGTDFIMEDIRGFGDKTSDVSTGDPQRDRVALDALKFYVSKMNPEKYGERVDLNVRGRLDMGAILIAADKRLAALPTHSALRLPDVSTESDE